MSSSEDAVTAARSYPERHTLSGGEVVLLRPVTPEDRETMLERFEHLSSESRFFRFFTPKGSLSERELDRLTDVDGYRHFALGAVLEASGVPVAIAHFFRSADEAGEAEMAITVIDEHQGRGMGELLFRRLIAAAIERGIEVFLCDVMYENVHMRHLVERIAPGAESRTLRGVTSYRVVLDSSQAVMTPRVEG